MMTQMMRHLAAPMVVMATVAAPAAPVMAQTVKRELVRYDNVQIEVMSQGRGPVIVMLPSLGRSGRDYDKVAANLEKDGFRVLRPEPRGIGRSKGPMEKLSIHDFARDIAKVVEHEKAGPVVVVGHAWGNFPARQLATDRPDLVRGVVLAAASAGKVPPGSTEKPINAEMREAIDGPSHTELPEEKRLEYLRKAFFAPGNDPRVWLTGWHKETHDAQGYARNNTPVDDYFAAGTAPIPPRRTAQPADGAGHLDGELPRGGGHPPVDDLRLARRRRVVDPVVEAAALERVVQVARPVRREDDDRRERRHDRAELGHGDARRQRHGDGDGAHAGRPGGERGQPDGDDPGRQQRPLDRDHQRGGAAIGDAQLGEYPRGRLGGVHDQHGRRAGQLGQLNQGRVGQRIAADQLGGQEILAVTHAGQLDLDLGRILDDVVVRQDEPGLVDDEPAAGALHVLFLRRAPAAAAARQLEREHVAEPSHLPSRGRRDAHDGRAGLLRDRAKRRRVDRSGQRGAVRGRHADVAGEGMRHQIQPRGDDHPHGQGKNCDEHPVEKTRFANRHIKPPCTP